MKASITVRRKTKYCAIVDLTEEEYAKLTEALDSDQRSEQKWAEEHINSMIDEGDWVDDELDWVEEFERVTEEQPAS